MPGSALSTPPRPESAGRFVAGTVLSNRYRIVSLIGRGGMGEVYQADDLKLDQTVALKFLPEALAMNAGALARFHAEVRIARQVSHPSVCRVYDVGEVDGLQYLTMEFIDGGDGVLRDWRTRAREEICRMRANGEICRNASGRPAGVYWASPADILMVLRPIALTLGCGLALTLVCAPLRARQRTEPGRVTLDGVLADYLNGDVGVVARTFTRSRDFQAARIANPEHIERWLASWNRGKAAMLIELAEASTRVAPQYTPFLLGAGRQYVRATREGNEPPGVGAAFVRLWHRAAVGLLHRAGDPAKTEEYVESLAVRLESSADRPALDSRLALAVAIAQEHRCWFGRPVLDLADAPIVEFTKAAGVRVEDPQATPPSEKARQVIEYRDCLRLAIARFTEAAEFAETRAEARLRAGWMLFQAGQFQDAFDRLDVGDVGEDRDLAYWAAIFRGRVLTALERHEEAVEAYRSALLSFPGAQSASVGLTLALFRVDRLAEADELARALRARTAPAEDPWPRYVEGDSRFVDQWIQQLRGSIR